MVAGSMCTNFWQESTQAKEAAATASEESQALRGSIAKYETADSSVSETPWPKKKSERRALRRKVEEGRSEGKTPGENPLIGRLWPEQPQAGTGYDHGNWIKSANPDIVGQNNHMVGLHPSRCVEH